MKIIFLDIDGVLNSRQYDDRRRPEDGNIDKSRLPLLKQLVDRTGARIVLTSSWRCHWDPMGTETDAAGRELVRTFLEGGIRLHDRTPVVGNNRPEEIRAWLADHPVQGFVILDDIKLGWGSLEPYTVKTDYRIGRGLEQRHIERAIEILMEAE